MEIWEIDVAILETKSSVLLKCQWQHLGQNLPHIHQLQVQNCDLKSCHACKVFTSNSPETFKIRVTSCLPPEKNKALYLFSLTVFLICHLCQHPWSKGNKWNCKWRAIYYKNIKGTRPHTLSYKFPFHQPDKLIFAQCHLFVHV